MKRFKAILIPAMCACLLTSCWDEHSIQETSYFTAIGIDYLANKEQFVVEATLITLSDVAKTEGSNSKAFPTYVGKGEGESVHLALENIYKSTQLLPSLEHLMTIVVRDRALPKLGEIMDSMNRSRTVRYNIDIMATSEPIQDVLQSDTFFNSPMYTFLYRHQIKGPAKPPHPPQSMQTLVREYYDESRTSLLPNLALDRTSWQHGGKKPNYLYYTGAYTVGAHVKSKYADETELKGSRWFYSNPEGSYLVLRDDRGRMAGVLVVSDNDYRIRFVKRGDRGRFAIELNVEAYINELHVKADEEQLRKWATAVIREEVDTTLGASKAKQADLLNLENVIYRSHVRDWKKMKASGENFYSLPCDIKVSLRIKNTGKLKLK
ncbi:Ger(x)C family spore germination C-terminal domain-containing protein [Cohnella sp. JJ-181]|uniref:Ger(x)C family spore germination protein n=1 Tax=Cohnella rhizoplanae TaxID=2974897 RepID=UPI0022FF827B|nr:Ger(x)C family spore germination C-terminal domain-containing protein [Cohnella sp. JJ-181]CAI6085104.1 hypothetical protein COHCIP112018_04561 [Cohnella sp. JJ-181]